MLPNGASEITKLNIGCGFHIEPTDKGWCNIDKTLNPGVDLIFDLDKIGDQIKLPFKDSSIEFTYASHILEHITNILPLMEELWRVTVPGGEMMIRVPHGSNDIAFEDPTHVRYFFPKSFMYFGQYAYNAAVYEYKGDWEIGNCTVTINDLFDGADMKELENLLAQARNVGMEVWVKLVAIKPARKAGEGGKGVIPISLVFEHQMKKHFEQSQVEPANGSLS